MFFNGNRSQKKIAIEIGVSEKTVYNWIRFFSWHKMREAAMAAPAMIADNICIQLIAFQKAIATRPEGEQFPTPQEINLQCKLINCLDKLKKYPSKGQTIQAVTNFMHFVDDSDENLGMQIMEKFDEYMQQKVANGHQPWDIEYGPNPFIFAPPQEMPDMETGKKLDEMNPENATENIPRTIDSKASQPVSGSFPPPERTGNAPQPSGRKVQAIQKQSFAGRPFRKQEGLVSDNRRAIIGEPATLPRTG